MFNIQHCLLIPSYSFHLSAAPSHSSQYVVSLFYISAFNILNSY